MEVREANRLVMQPVQVGRLDIRGAEDADVVIALVVGQDEDDDIEKCSVLLVQSATGVTAVTVDRVVTSYDLVVKNMGAYVKSIAGGWRSIWGELREDELIGQEPEPDDL